MNVVWLSLGLFFLFMILGVPIAMSIGLAAGASLLAMDTSLVVMAQKMFISTNSFTLIAIPFFMLVGAIMDRSGITEMLVNFAKACIGWIRYGMVYVTILAGILMGGISGSATADTAALSGILIPTMERQGYPRNFTAPLQASAGTLGVIIPPSLCMIVLGSVTNLQVSKLFIAGIIPASSSAAARASGNPTRCASVSSSSARPRRKQSGRCSSPSSSSAASSLACSRPPRLRSSP